MPGAVGVGASIRGTPTARAPTVDSLLSERVRVARVFARPTGKVRASKCVSPTSLLPPVYIAAPSSRFVFTQPSVPILFSLSRQTLTFTALHSIAISLVRDRRCSASWCIRDIAAKYIERKESLASLDRFLCSPFLCVCDSCCKRAHCARCSIEYQSAGIPRILKLAEI
ncbi:unnamed protein product [Trichogramma brassicae]|uniref:Uncharacterized protein n=1 Tax=Trichogramma brassicae TaxID=86971 RepID=A0A6H5IXQ6_9HYME|nr:unnamed protein product [Trichogramma brassicae]